jgi:hypothetical protein
MNKTKSCFLREVRKYKDHLTRQQFKTLRGQVINGECEGAKKGLEKILNRRMQPEHTKNIC